MNDSLGHAVRGNVSPTYSTWQGMKTRCLNPNADNYARYGGLGIGVCDKWLSFAGFLEDMGNKPEGLTLERLDGTKGYYKDNCKWASYSEQNINQVTRKDNVLQQKNIRLTRFGFQVRVQRNGNSICVGTYPTLEQAVKARDKFTGVQYE